MRLIAGEEAFWYAGNLHDMITPAAPSMCVNLRCA